MAAIITANVPVFLLISIVFSGRGGLGYPAGPDVGMPDLRGLCPPQQNAPWTRAVSCGPVGR